MSDEPAYRSCLHKGLALLLVNTYPGVNRLQIRTRGIGRICTHPHFLTPSGQDHLPQHLAKQRILIDTLCALWV